MQVHFPKELSARLLFGLGVSVLMIIRWSQSHHVAATAKNSTQSADFHIILAMLILLIMLYALSVTTRIDITLYFRFDT